MKLYRVVRINMERESLEEGIECISWHPDTKSVDRACAIPPEQYRVPSIDYDAITFELDEFETKPTKSEILKLLNKETDRKQIIRQINERSDAQKKALEAFEVSQQLKEKTE